MNEQFETQNPVENTVTPANQMETPTPEAPKKKGNKIMAKIASQLTELIGNTPLLELTNYEKELGLKAQIVAKLDYLTPLGSMLDREEAAKIKLGKKDGLINQETVIIEPTSGNTGIGLAVVSAAKGLHLILTMPDTMSVER